MNSITITYLSKVSFASLNGADKDVDNINPIKKVTLDNGQELPYVSSQAIRRALRDRLDEMGKPISKVTSGEGKNPPATEGDPAKYYDDDLFGYMNAKDRNQRTSPIRVESLLALPTSTYKGDLDYGTNFMGVNNGGEPNIYETEIHSGLYRGTILIELDRIGKGQTIKNKYDDSDFVDSDKEKQQRVLDFLDAFRSLWSSGRQTRFLADISPKFIAAAYMSVKNPVFLEAVNIDERGKVKVEELQGVVDDYGKFIEQYVFANQKATLETTQEINSLKEGFEQIESWINDYYKGQA
ncbi:MAG: type I-B CRISPR-associated protein Cas7/Cst2/DevR [Bacteroidota bacterium]